MKSRYIASAGSYEFDFIISTGLWDRALKKLKEISKTVNDRDTVKTINS